jgi:purine-nucleoside phosphorylase
VTTVDVRAAAEALRSRSGLAPEVAIVLGSGLGAVEAEVEDAEVMGFDELPGFPPSGVLGHAGRFVFGRLAGVDVLLQSGRYHLYEGHGPEVVAAPTRVLAAVGVRTLVLTNAAGGVRRTLGPGDLVLLEDHVNWVFRSPLTGPVAESETRFPDMSAPYNPELRDMAMRVALERGIRLEEGTYAALLGPQYETAAEVRMLERLGADVVGMSTVPEVLVARALGLRCLAFSVVANVAVGLGGGPLGHEEVVAVVRSSSGRLATLLGGLLPRIAASPYPVSTK